MGNCLSSTTVKNDIAIEIPRLPGRPPEAANPCTMVAVVPVSTSTHIGGFAANLEPVYETIGSDQFTGAGWQTKACYIPTNFHDGTFGGQAVGEHENIFAAVPKAHLVLTRSTSEDPPLQTLCLKTQLKLQAGPFSVAAERSDPLYAALSQACEQGYMLRSVLATPDSMASDIGTTVTGATLICQRPHGGDSLATRPSDYLVVGISAADKVSGQLATILSDYGRQGYRLVDVYDPFFCSAIVSLIFENVRVPMTYFLVDGPGFHRAKFSFSQGYSAIVNGFNRAGWQLASLVDVAHSAGAHVRLVFVAPSSWTQLQMGTEPKLQMGVTPEPKLQMGVAPTL